MNILKIKNLEKSFGDNKVLKGIDLNASQGDVISIIGSSGSGKSTLLRCVNFLENANHGTINVCGHEIDCAKENLEKPGKELQGNIIKIRKNWEWFFKALIFGLI